MAIPPDGCNLACQTKIILNGGNLRGIVEANYQALKRFKDKDFDRLRGKDVIAILNRMEDDAVKVQKLIVQGAGYGGPTGKMLKG